MEVHVGDVVEIRQRGEDEPEFLRGRVVEVLSGTNNADWRGFYYRVMGQGDRDVGPQLFAYLYSVARVECPHEAN